MLARTEGPSRFKLYAHDCGMLMSCYPIEVAADVLAGAKSVNFGAVYKNFVAQELAAAGVKLRYYHNNRRGEVDFVVQRGRAVLPIEVKSGNDWAKHKALDNLLSVQEWNIPEALILCKGNVAKEGKVTYLPLYMAMFIQPAKLSEQATFEVDLSALNAVPPE